MARYHIGKNGKPSACRAEVQACPLGGAHFESKAAAWEHVEKEYAAAEETFNTITKRQQTQGSYLDPQAARQEEEQREASRQALQRFGGALQSNFRRKHPLRAAMLALRIFTQGTVRYAQGSSLVRSSNNEASRLGQELIVRRIGSDLKRVGLPGYKSWAQVEASKTREGLW